MRSQVLHSKLVADTPPVVYVTGKTCTGKSTFARSLAASGLYAHLELDEIMYRSLIDPLRLHAIKGDVFDEVYHKASNKDWTDTFVRAVKHDISAYLSAGKNVVIDGAVAEVGTIRCFLADCPSARVVYFHHAPDSNEYRANILRRLREANSPDSARLPNTFWEFVDRRALARFYAGEPLSESVLASIDAYITHSSHSSKARLAHMRHALARSGASAAIAVTVVEL